MPELPDVGAFRVADAVRAGIPRRAVDAPALHRPFHGVRAASPALDLDPADAQLAAAAAYTVQAATHQFFSHATAALLWGVPLPFVRDGVDVSVLAPDRAPRGRGVRGHQLEPAATTVVTRPEGVRLTDPACTWTLLGTILRHPYDLVAAADALVRDDRLPGPSGRILTPAATTVEALTRAVARAHGRRGIVALREALARVRPGAASRMETWTRLTLVDAGLPEPVTDHDVYDARGFVGCVDLAYPAQRIAIEYEGDHHRTSAAQWHRDVEKHERLAQAGWRVIRVTREMLLTRPGALILAVRAALASR